MIRHHTGGQACQRGHHLTPSGIHDSPAVCIVNEISDLEIKTDKTHVRIKKVSQRNLIQRGRCRCFEVLLYIVLKSLNINFILPWLRYFPSLSSQLLLDNDQEIKTDKTHVRIKKVSQRNLIQRGRCRCFEVLLYIVLKSLNINFILPWLRYFPSLSNLLLLDNGFLVVIRPSSYTTCNLADYN